MSEPNAPGEIIDVFAAIQRIGQQAVPMLTSLTDPQANRAAILAKLMPRPGDVARAFRADIVPRVEDAYAERMRSGLPEIVAGPGQTEVTVNACPAGFLGHDNPLSAPFPAAYKALAPFLIRKRVWIVWRFARPGATDGVQDDGLVWLGDHWAWFPEPYQVVGELVDP